MTTTLASAPSVLDAYKKRLSIHFERSVSPTTSRPDTLEIVVTPLNEASIPDLDVTLAPDKQIQKVVLSEAVTVVFDLVPTYLPGLSEPIFYRLSYRTSYMGRITETDFAMPETDVDWDDLADLGNIVTGENYLRMSDLSVPSRAAQLNDLGQVIDADGNVLANFDSSALQAQIVDERVARINGDTTVNNNLTLRIDTKVNQTTANSQAAINNEIINRQAADEQERTARTAADNQIDLELGQLTATTASRLNGHDTVLTRKADLVGGIIPPEQLPSLAVNSVVVVANEAEMLALRPDQVQQGDIAARPDGVWMLAAQDPSKIENWFGVTAQGAVTSVNGKVGAVVLTAANVNARPTGVLIEMVEVNGLNNAMLGKASTTALASTNTNVANLGTQLTSLSNAYTDLNNVAVKKDGGGEIDSNVLKSDITRVDGSGVLRRKNGTVIPVGEVTSVNGRKGIVFLDADAVSARGLGPIPQGDIIDLPVRLNAIETTLTAKADDADLATVAEATLELDTRVDNHDTRIGDLEAASGAGTGFTQTLRWVGAPGTSPKDVTLNSPFGITGGGASYYNPNGATAGEAAWPYVDANGCLTLRKPNPLATPASPPATQSSLDALTARVVTLEQGGGGGGTGKPAGGWLRTDLAVDVQTTLSLADTATALATPNAIARRDAAGTFQVSAPTVGGHVATKLYVDNGLTAKADASALTTTNTNVANLTTTVNGKASQSSVDTLTGRVTTNETALASKADLSGGKVPLAQIPNFTGGSKITDYASKADLVTGTVPLAQLPSIPQSQVTSLSTTLAGKADLSGGKVPSSQLPALATGETYVVASVSEMLALTTAQVQRGDFAVVSSGPQRGSYILNGVDPSQIDQWVLLAPPASGGAVLSVNGQTGDVVLGAADVSARPAAVSIPQADVTNLATDLAAKAATTYVDAQVATRTTPATVTSTVNSAIASQNPVKLAVDAVAVSAVASLSGAQSIDGALRGAGSRVLLTAQSSSAQNGVWLVASGAWTRPTDMSNGAIFLPGTEVIAKTGSAYANSIWQITNATSGTVDTNGQTWARSLQGGPPVTYTSGNGIDIAGTTVSAKAGSGIIVDGTGIRLDTSGLPRGFVYDVPAGSTAVSIPHNLNTLNIWVALRDKASGDIQLIGPTATSVNTATIEFGTAPSANQYAAIVFGI